MRHLMKDIADLHMAFGHPVRTDPVSPSSINEMVDDPTSGDAFLKKRALQARLLMRVRLVTEEFFELLEGAIGPAQKRLLRTAEEMVVSVLGYWHENYDYNAIETADALADLVVVIVGMALELGLPLDRVWDEVHRANMAKVGPDGKVMYRGDGKVLKPEGWTPPDIKKAVFGERSPKPLSPEDELKFWQQLTMLLPHNFEECNSPPWCQIEDYIGTLRGRLLQAERTVRLGPTQEPNPRKEAMGRFEGEGQVPNDFDEPLPYEGYPYSPSKKDDGLVGSDSIRAAEDERILAEMQDISPQKPLDKLVQKALNVVRADARYVGERFGKEREVALRELREAAMEYEAKRKKQESNPDG